VAKGNLRLDTEKTPSEADVRSDCLKRGIAAGAAGQIGIDREPLFLMAQRHRKSRDIRRPGMPVLFEAGTQRFWEKKR
jgi:hypothetical protein